MSATSRISWSNHSRGLTVVRRYGRPASIHDVVYRTRSARLFGGRVLLRLERELTGTGGWIADLWWRRRG